MLNPLLLGIISVFVIWFFGISIKVGGSLLYLVWILLIVGISQTLFSRNRAR